MSIPIDKHIEFYKAEYNSQLIDWQSYISTPIKTLINSRTRELYAGFAWGVEANSGSLIIKVRSSSTPRLNRPYFLSVVLKPKQPPREWLISYKEFREHHHENYYQGWGTACILVNYWKTEGEFLFYLCEVFDDQLVANLENYCFSKSIHPLIIIAEADPPLKYLENLQEYLENYRDNRIANFFVEDTKIWKPKNLDNSQDITQFLLDQISANRTTLVQGPPGTGKSYVAASIANEYVYRNKSVVICSLANKGLMEIAGQPTLNPALVDGKVFKTNISNLEKKQQSKLKKRKELNPVRGELLLTTYYTLSNYLTTYENNKVSFDLVIIEEASQAFLATIAMFDEISERTLIIGDHKQIPPVVTLENRQLLRIHPQLSQVIHGLQTFALNKTDGAFRLTKTRRLTKEAASLTGIFYDNSLKSISDFTATINHNNKFEALFRKNGGASIVHLPFDFPTLESRQFVQKLVEIVVSLLTISPEITVAVLSSKKDMEGILSSEFYKVSRKFDRVHFSTVHRAQGLTVDYCIFYMPLEATHMDLNPNLFNVATSRARRGTCIITKESVNLMTNFSNEVSGYIASCEDVTQHFLTSMEVEF
jgi:hypothetical protein